MAIVSMTGFAEAHGSREGARWRWEAKSVNGRGLDLRLRTPPGFDGIEPVARALAAERFKRGSIQAQLTFESGDVARGLRIDPVALAAAAVALLAMWLLFAVALRLPLYAGLFAT
jgi:uncharacterized protein YicC (UPF0701 family)